MILPEMLLSPSGGTVGLCSGLILILVSENSEGGFGGVWIPIFSSCCDIWPLICLSLLHKMIVPDVESFLQSYIGGRLNIGIEQCECCKLKWFSLLVCLRLELPPT